MLDKITRRSALNLGATALAGATMGLPGRASAADVSVSYADWQLAQDIWGRSLLDAFKEFEQQNPGVKVTTSRSPSASATSNSRPRSAPARGRTCSPST